MTTDLYMDEILSFDLKKEIEKFAEETYWNVRVFLDAMVIIKHMDLLEADNCDDEAEEQIFLLADKSFKEYFSSFKQAIQSKQIILIEGMEREPSKPSYLSWQFGLVYNVKKFLLVGIGEKVMRLNKDYRLLNKFILPTEGVNFARDFGIEIPHKTSVIPENSQPLRQELSKDERIREIIKEICTIDRTNPGAKGLWDRRDEVLYDAIEFMIDTVDLGKCKCRHDKLASITYRKGTDRDGTPLKSLDKVRFGLERKFKEAAFYIVIPERRLGYKSDGEFIYDKKECNCSIPSHITFLDPSRKNAKAQKTE